MSDDPADEGDEAASGDVFVFPGATVWTIDFDAMPSTVWCAFGPDGTTLTWTPTAYEFEPGVTAVPDDKETT